MTLNGVMAVILVTYKPYGAFRHKSTAMMEHIVNGSRF